VFTVASITALALLVVFAIAATTKLADLAGTRRAVADFGVPERIATTFGTALPLLELGIAALLAFSATATAGALTALAMLVLFSGAVGANLARGRTPDCRCFGQVSSTPIGWATLARNLVLIVVAVLGAVALASEPDASAVAWLGRLDATATALAAAAAASAVAALAVAVALQVLRGHGRLLLRIDRLEAALASAGIEIPQLEEGAGLPVGSEAPGFSLKGLDEQEVDLDELLSLRRPLLLVFTDAGCAPCHELLPEISAWQVEHEEALTVALAAQGSAEELRRSSGEHELENVLLDEGGELFGRYEADATPSAVLIGSDRTVASPVAAGPGRIRALKSRAIGSGPGEPGGLRVGEPAPSIELGLLDGGTVEIAEPSAKRRLLLFWNPTCGHCRRMHDELLRWEAGARNGAPELLVIASGDEDAIRAEGFRSPVALDHDSRAARALSANGTPMAILLDQEARIASALAAGSDEVMALAQGEAVVGR
jgi:peroxiredoxin